MKLSPVTLIRHRLLIRVKRQVHIQLILSPGGGGGGVTSICWWTGMCHFLGYLFWADFGFMGVIFSFLRIFWCHFKPSPDLWVYFWKKLPKKIIFPAFLMLDTVVSALWGSCFPNLWVSFFGSAARFIGAIFKAKMAHPRIKKVWVTPPPEILS